MSRKRMIAILIGIIIVLLLLMAVAYYSGITGGTITSSVVVSRFAEEVSLEDSEKEEINNAQDNSGQG